MPIQTDVEMITIPVSIFDNLILDRKKLRALEDAGVDNWEGYDYAMEDFYA